MEINDADVAELVDARDLKSPDATEITHICDLTWPGNPHEAGGDPAVLSNTPSPFRAGWQALEKAKMWAESFCRTAGKPAPARSNLPGGSLALIERPTDRG